MVTDLVAHMIVIQTHILIVAHITVTNTHILPWYRGPDKGTFFAIVIASSSLLTRFCWSNGAGHLLILNLSAQVFEKKAES